MFRFLGWWGCSEDTPPAHTIICALEVTVQIRSLHTIIALFLVFSCQDDVGYVTSPQYLFSRKPNSQIIFDESFGLQMYKDVSVSSSLVPGDVLCVVLSEQWSKTQNIKLSDLE